VTDLELRLKHRGISLSRRPIFAWERGQREPSLSQSELEALADALRWDLGLLVDAMRDGK
jgi:hypothetical protein